ncbi:TldD/PmbA family protein [Turneriella parva]|uniref:Microcin-processing peptidase 2 n=1 Tax=Turneriella parva (strain ATCC BAA-1111 / DSM 21527 / NCTC 11395 / H) TaxID=869212 RepID=I4BAP3_TURPD|nr:TldD/PmbA family protein [Turneriella parva]AFM14350.1 microcin-processing peptidase 2 [Turneriella parva DSM 21527]
MNQTVAEDILSAALSQGADFADLYEEETRNAAVSLRDHKIENATAGIEYGIGLRLIYGTDVVYGYTSSDSKDALSKLLAALVAARAATARLPGNARAALKPIHQAPAIQNILRRPADAGQAAKLPLLMRADKQGYAVSPLVQQVSASLVDSTKHIQIANSEGLFISDSRTRTRFSVSVTAEKAGERFVAGESPGALQGFEFFDNLDIESLTREAAERAVRMLDAGYIEGKKMPIILGPGFGGVIFHEACGHPLETEALRKKATPFAGKQGQLIAHPAVTAIDDGTIFGSWGSVAIDDEGMPTEKTVLIENGILKNYISDRVGSIECNVRRTGSARRESYQYAPVSRMRNTYIAAGSSSLAEMLAGIDDGLYAPKLGGGSVNPATGEFNFAVEEGYRIRSGKIAEGVRGATLIGKGHEILPLISMVGSDLEITAGMCGASSGSVPVTVGQPTLKVDEILVGGR